MQGFADARLNDEGSETEPRRSSPTSYPLPQTLHTLSLVREGVIAILVHRGSIPYSLFPTQSAYPTIPRVSGLGH